MNNENMSNENHKMQNSDYGMDFSEEAFNYALELIEEAVQDERADEMKYDYLLTMAPTDDEVEIIESIRNDERNHRKWFREIYYYYTGNEIDINNEEFNEPDSYLNAIANSVLGELNAVEKYRFIREGLPKRLFRDILFRIITDEMKHSTKYNLILNLHAFSHENM